MRLRPTKQAAKALEALRADKGRAIVLKAVTKALEQLELDHTHPGLNVHPRRGEKCPHDKTLFQAYAQNHTPGAFRIFYCFCLLPGDEPGLINVIAITPHP